MYDQVGPEGMNNMGGFDGSQGGFGGFGVRVQLVMHFRQAHKCMEVGCLLHSDKFAIALLSVALWYLVSHASNTHNRMPNITFNVFISIIVKQSVRPVYRVVASDKPHQRR